MTKRSTRVTMEEVAERAGVSHSTVSRVLADHPNVHGDTRSRVLLAVEELGYVVHPGARSLAGGKRGIIGVMVLDLTSAYINQVVQFLDAAMMAEDYAMLLGTTRNRGNEPGEYTRQLEAEGLCDGVILVLPGQHETFSSALSNRSIPYVLLDHPFSPHADSVLADNKSGTYQAVAHLADLGHRRVGFVGGLLSTAAGRDREEAFRQAAVDFNFDQDIELFVDGDFREHTAYDATIKLLSLDSRPSAIFASADAAAIGALAACRRLGLDVPGDISVVGFDDLPISKTARPALTTVHQPLGVLAERGVDLLLRRIADPDKAAEHIQLGTHLVVRESTGPAHLGGVVSVDDDERVED